MSVRAGGRTATGTDSVRACGLSLEGKGQVQSFLVGFRRGWRRSQPGHAAAIAGWAASFHGLAAGQGARSSGAGSAQL